MNARGFLLAIPLIVAAPVQAQTTGAYIDGQLGWDHLPVIDQTGSTGAVESKNRLIFGGGGGYDVRIAPRIVLGIDTNYDSGTKSDCQSSVLTSGDMSCGKLVRDLDIGGRVGVKAGPLLVYGRAAYDNVLLRSRYTAAAGATAATNSNDYGGFRLAAGVELPVSGPVFVKTEYRWTDASRIPNQQQILTGVGIHF